MWLQVLALTATSVVWPPDDVAAWMASLPAEADFVDRVALVAEAQLGIAYAGGPLGEGDPDAFDPDPLYDLARVDCVTFVEQTLALAAAPSEWRMVLQELRYNGDIGFLTRNHFFVADWVPDNRAWLSDRTTGLGVPTEKVTRTISYDVLLEKVGHPPVDGAPAPRAVTIDYVPRERAAEAVAAIDTPSLVVFIGKVDWLFALHCGFAFPRSGGAEPGAGAGVDLVHAGTDANAVAREDLVAYLARKEHYLGFQVYTLRAPAPPS